MNKLFLKFKEKWLELKEDGCCLTVAIFSVIALSTVSYFLYSQTSRLHVIKAENISLVETNNILQAELNSIKAQLQFNTTPIVSEESKPLDIVIQSNAQEIKGKVNEIQQQLIDGSSTQKTPPTGVARQPTRSDVRQLNNSLQQTFCASNPTHETCKEAR